MTREPVRLYAAGSLRAALTAIADVFHAETGLAVAGCFGASGLLRERIERGEPAEVFASADMGHPQNLAQAGRFVPPVLFTRNEMCTLVHPAVDVASDTLLDRMLDPGIRLGTSTPKADPSGDYAWAVFRKAEAIRPGSFAQLEAKALQLTGGARAPCPPTATPTACWWNGARPTSFSPTAPMPCWRGGKPRLCGRCRCRPACASAPITVSAW